MRMRFFVALMMLCGICGAQVVMEQQTQMSRTGPADEPNKPKPTAEQLQRGRQMLETAEASAQGMEGGMRAYGLLQVANAYARTDKKKAMQLLNDALAATKGMEDDGTQTKNRLQEQILQAIVPLAPGKADELLNEVEPSARGRVLNSLLSYYQKNDDWDRAIEVIYRIAPEQEVPYDVVAKVMTALPEERSGDRQQLFSTALTSFKSHPPMQRGRVSFGGGDFSSLIMSQWKKLGKETALDAIHAVLDQTKQQAKDSGTGQPMAIAMSSANGGVQFNSMYEFRLFQLLPVLKQLDSSEADKLVKESQAVQSMMDKYPDGMNSIAPPQSSNNRGPNSSGSNMMSMSMGGPGPGPGSGSGARGPSMNPMMMQQMSKIMQDASKHPADALANAAALPDMQMRAQAYMGIAQVNAKANASVTKQALEKVVDALPELEVNQQVMMVANVAKLYVEVEDPGSANKVIEKGMGIA
jgi:hypothetical protein